MLILVIRTPEDFALTLDTPMYRINQWLLPELREWGASVDEAVARITMQRALIDGPNARARRDPSAVEACLAAVEEPLVCLHAIGLQMVAILTPRGRAAGAASGHARIAVRSLSITDYLVAPDPCYFRPERPDLTGAIHRLGAQCQEGHGQIVLDSAGGPERVFSIWSSLEILDRDFERRVPWCDTCRDADEEEENPEGDEPELA